MLLRTFAHMAFNRWLWIVVVVFSQFTLSQEIQGNTSLKKTNVLSAHNDAFKGGEWFKFRIHYGIF